MNGAEKAGLPFNFRNVFGLESPFQVQRLGTLSSKQDVLFGELDQDQTHQLAHVHPRDHLLKAGT